MTLFYILLAILVFGFLIFIHEFGHFITAKLLDVQVNEFSICMGPALFQKQRGETTYSLRAIPIGGYCAMEGEDETCDNPRAFTSKSWWRRLIILSAGSFMNFLTGFVIIAILYATAGGGFYIPSIAGFFDGAVLQSEDGLHTGDRILKVDGENVYVFSDLSMLLERNSSQVYDLVLLRDGEKVELKNFTMKTQTFEIDGQPVNKYGIYFATEDKSVATVLKNAWLSAVDFGRMVKLGLLDLFSGSAGINDMSGPVGIVQVITETGESAENTTEGVENVLYLCAFIAVNLAFMNMLPIPALDGGRIFFLIVTSLVETVTRRRVNPKYEGYIHAAGMAILLSFMAFITFHDIIKLFT